MWQHNGKTIKEGRAWVSVDGIKHPRNWAIWSDSIKTSFGLVWVNDPAPTKKVFSLATQKENAINTVKQTALRLLSETDWYVVKATEVSEYSVPSKITEYRAAVRAASNNIETAITNAADQSAFDALSDRPENGNAPINDWPDEI